MSHYTNTTTDHNGVINLADGAITAVKIEPLAPRYRAPYSEQPTDYKIRLRGEKIWRRVYATALGNVHVIYFKSRGHTIYCKRELKRALAAI